jgi:ABC-type amino acid transport substrate-binding protein
MRRREVPWRLTEERRRRIAFTTEVFPTRTAVVTRRPHRVVKTLEELRAERVGVVKGTSMAEAVESAAVPRASVDDSIPSGGGPAALKSGKVTATVLGVENAITAQRDDPEPTTTSAGPRPGARWSSNISASRRRRC